MEKSILADYSEALARVKLLREQMEKKQRHLDKLRAKDYVVADTVTYGKKGKKPLGTTKIIGYPFPEAKKAAKQYEKQRTRLAEEEQGLLELITQVEEYIRGVDDIEIRNLMTLYYVDDKNWVQVAHRMNYLYPKRKGEYTADSCRCKHDRFLEKF